MLLCCLRRSNLHNRQESDSCGAVGFFACFCSISLGLQLEYIPAVLGRVGLSVQLSQPMSSLRTVPLLLATVFAILHCFNGAIAYSAHEPHLPQSLSGVPQSVVSLIARFWDIFGPGGKFHPTAFIESKGHLVLEGLLVLVILYLFLQKSFNPSFQKQLQTELTEQAGAQLTFTDPLHNRKKTMPMRPQGLLTSLTQCRKSRTYAMIGSQSHCSKQLQTISLTMILQSSQGSAFWLACAISQSVWLTLG